jgi:hypothetical protein
VASWLAGQRVTGACRFPLTAACICWLQAIDKGNLEGAKIYAENTIRKKNESLQMLQLSSRIDGVASKLQSISAQRGVARSMAGISQQLGMAMQSMDTMQIAQSMDQFERQVPFPPCPCPLLPPPPPSLAGCRLRCQGGTEVLVWACRGGGGLHRLPPPAAALLSVPRPTNRRNRLRAQLQELDVQGSMIGAVMDSSTANSTPVDEVGLFLFFFFSGRLCHQPGRTIREHRSCAGGAGPAAAPPRTPRTRTWPPTYPPTHRPTHVLACRAGGLPHFRGRG